MRLTLLLLGGRRISVSKEYSSDVMNLLLQMEYPYEQAVFSEENGLSFVCSLVVAKRLRAECTLQGVPIKIEGTVGFPPFLFRYRKRLGLLLGGLLSLFLLFFSRQFVWDVRVSGNVSMSDAQVLEELASCGLSVGSYIPNLHIVSLENRVLMHSDRISWLAICLDGTVAQVQVIEHIPPTPSEGINGSPANVVASCDGQIELIELYRGDSTVKIGQAVRKGDLLISGIYDSATHGFRYTRAAGRILARTERKIRIEIPFSCEVKQYEENHLASLSMNFFDFSFNFYKKGGNEDMLCDIIKEEINFSLFGSYALPFSVTAEHAAFYRMQPYERTEQEASDLAYASLEHELAALSADAQMLRKSIVSTITEDTFVLECTVVCIEDIAQQLDFEMIQQP